MLTVVHVITRLELGGAQQNTLSTCRGLAARGVRTALVYGPGGELDDQLKTLDGVWGHPVASLDRDIRPGRDARAVRDVRATLESLRRAHRAAGGDDRGLVVHTHSSKAGIVGRTAAASMGLRTVVHSIHGFPFHEGQPRPRFEAYVAAERAMSRFTRAFVAVARANVAEGQARGIIRPEHRVAIIRSGMDLQPFFSGRRAKAAARARHRVPVEAPLFTSVSNLKPQKDPLTAIEAMRRVVDALPTARLWYVGDGPLRPRVEARIRELALTDHVHLWGWRRDVPELMCAADVIVLSSRFEGLPRSAVQAVAVGRPFVGCRVDGTPEIIRCGQDGYLVEPGRPSDLARAMIRAHREQPVRAEAEPYLSPWSIDVLVNRQQTLYEELTA